MNEILKKKSQYELRQDLESLVVNDILGPAAGPRQEIDAGSVRDRDLPFLLYNTPEKGGTHSREGHCYGLLEFLSCKNRDLASDVALWYLRIDRSGRALSPLWCEGTQSHGTFQEVLWQTIWRFPQHDLCGNPGHVCQD